MHKGHMRYGSICCTYHQLKYSSPNRSNKQKKPRDAQKSLPFGKWRFREKEVRRTGQKKKNKTERATGLGIRTKGEIQKSGIKLKALKFQTGGRHQKSPASLWGATALTIKTITTPEKVKTNSNCLINILTVSHNCKFQAESNANLPGICHCETR